MLLDQKDTRTPGQWLYDDLLAGDTNTQFKEITQRAAGLFDIPAPIVNGPVSVPTSPGDLIDSYNGPGAGSSNQVIDNTSGLLAQIKDMFTAMLGILGKPSSSVVNAPVTNTSYEENVSVDNSVNYFSEDNRVDNSVTNYSSSYSYMNTYGIGGAELERILMRFTDLLAVPQGGNQVISPGAPTEGYAQNVSQSAPRLGGQTIASVAGLELNTGGVGIGRTALPWKTIIMGAVASLIVFLLYKKFFRK